MTYGLGGYKSWEAENGNVRVESHSGDRRDFLRRYERKTATAIEQGLNGIAKLGPKLLKLVADARSLHAAWDFLKRNGGTAPGPNGLKYDDLTGSEVWELLRALGKSLRNGTYCAGPDRKVNIAKSSGRGYRTLRLQNLQDRVVARAIVQITQPLLDPGFDENSFGYRPGRDRCHALAKAMQLAKNEDRMVWLLEDVKDAFDQVPLKRLFDVIRRVLPAAESLWQLIERVLGSGTKRGIRQGSPLSPLLLNLYLDHFLDRVWRRSFPDTPLLRSADDLLVLCRTEQEARRAQADLRRVLNPAGMPLKASDEAIRDLNNNDKADWLGFRITKGDDGLEVRISAAAWSALETGLKLAHKKPAAPLRATQIVGGWIDQLGPCFRHEDKDQVLFRISDVASRMSFRELPEAEELRGRWSGAYLRWQGPQIATSSAVLSTAMPCYSVSEDDGSADRHVF